MIFVVFFVFCLAPCLANKGQMYFSDIYKNEFATNSEQEVCQWCLDDAKKFINRFSVLPFHTKLQAALSSCYLVAPNNFEFCSFVLLINFNSTFLNKTPKDYCSPIGFCQASTELSKCANCMPGSNNMQNYVTGQTYEQILRNLPTICNTSLFQKKEELEPQQKSFCTEMLKREENPVTSLPTE